MRVVTASLWPDIAPGVGPTLALIGVLLTLWVNGARAERQRRRDLHARALKACLDYAEMPFAIRRRRNEPEHRSAERVRLSARFSEIQSEVAACEALLDADGDKAVADAYRRLIDATRSVAGEQAKASWKADPVDSDEAMNLPDVAEALKPLRAPRDAFRLEIHRAGRGTWQRVRDWHASI